MDDERAGTQRPVAPVPHRDEAERRKLAMHDVEGRFGRHHPAHGQRVARRDAIERPETGEMRGPVRTVPRKRDRLPGGQPPREDGPGDQPGQPGTGDEIVYRRVGDHGLADEDAQVVARRDEIGCERRDEGLGQDRDTVP